MKQEEWLNDFRSKNGRQPTLAEYQLAKENGFAVAGSAQESQSLNNWVADFEKKNQRKPSLQEVQDYKEVNQQNSLNTAAPSSVIDQSENTRQGTSQSRKTHKPIKHKGIKLTLLAIIVILVALVSYGYHYFSYANTLDRDVAALHTENLTKYQKISEWSDNKSSLSKEQLQPLANYFHKVKFSKAGIKTFINQDESGIHYTHDGQNFLIFPRYVLQLDPVTLNIKTNQSKLKLSVNAKTVTNNTSSNNSVSLKRQVPGLYQFVAQGNVNGQNVKTQSSGYYGVKQTNTVNLNIQIITFTVQSNLEGGTVFIGDNKVGTISNGSTSINDVAVTGDDTIYVQAKAGSDTIKSSSMNLSDIDDGDSINLNAQGILNQNEADSQLTDMASTFSDHAESTDFGGGDNSYNSANDIFTNGTNNQSYKDFIDLITRSMHSSKRNANSIDFSVNKVDSVTATAKNKADVKFELQERYYYTSDTDTQNNTSGDVTQTFLLTAHMVYNQSTNQWLVDNIDSNQQKLSEQNDVN